MSERNKNMVEKFFRHMSAGEVDDAFALVSSRVSWWVPGTLPFSGTKTKSKYLASVGRMRTGFSGGVRFDVKSMIGEGDSVAPEVESHGQHVNARTYNNTYHFLFDFDADQIVSVKEYIDTLRLHQLISRIDLRFDRHRYND